MIHLCRNFKDLFFLNLYQVRNLLCLLTKDLHDPTQDLCNLIHNRVKLTLSGIIPLANIDTAVRHEMALLESLVSQNDSCWEQKLRVVLEIFLMACRQVLIFVFFSLTFFFSLFALIP